MGQSQSDEEQEKFQLEFNANFNLIKETKDSRFGQICKSHRPHRPQASSAITPGGRLRPSRPPNVTQPPREGGLTHHRAYALFLPAAAYALCQLACEEIYKSKKGEEYVLVKCIWC